MKITVLLGHLRQNSNTEIVVDQFIENMRTTNILVEKIILKEMKIEPCGACWTCQDIFDRPGCPQNDDMNVIYSSVMASDAIISASPIYSWYCTPLLKSVMDRLVYGMNKYYGETEGPCLWEGKSLGLITTCGYGIEEGAGVYEEGLRRYAKHSRLNYIGKLAIQDIDGKAHFRSQDSQALIADYAKQVSEIVTRQKINALIKELQTCYISDPTTQPTAFWKFRDCKNDENLRVIENLDSYSFILNSTLLCRYPYDKGYCSQIDEALSEVVLAKEEPLDSKWSTTQYFKLFHTHETLEKQVLKPEFDYVNVDESELHEVAQFINDNYEHIRVNEKQVQSWTHRAVYHRDLWIWIVDRASKKKVALGIAELDRVIGEGALEWIQVDSTYRNKGLGKALVTELLNRLSQSADFTTVAGEVDNETKPELLYRSCGFQGERIWTVYQKR